MATTSVKAKSVLIGGGSGFVGKALTKALKDKGHAVKVISRKPGPINMTWTDLEKHGLPAGTSAVVSLAGQNVFDMRRRWTPGFKQNVWTSRVNTTGALAKAIKDADPKEKPDVFISMNGVGYYKPSDTMEYTEDSTGGNFDFLSELARAWEFATTVEGVRTVVLRSGVIIGKSGGVIQQMYWPFYFGVGGPVASGNQYFPWIHMSDIVGLILYAMENKRVEGVLNAVAPQIITNKQFSAALGRAMRRPAFLPVPEFVLNAAFSEERAKIMTQGQKVLPKRTEELGYKFNFRDIDLACKECVS